MRTSTVLVGLLFAVLVALALAAPLFFVLPAQYVPDDWYLISAPISAVGYAGAVVAIAGAGAAAAALNRDDSFRNATGAGAIAALFGGAVTAAPATSVQAAGELLTTPLAFAKNAELLPQVAEGLLAASWGPVAVALVMALIGPALGALGGATLDLYLGVGSRRAVRLVHRSAVPIWGLTALSVAMIVHSAFCALIHDVMMPNLRPLSMVDSVLLEAPTFAGATASAFLLGWAMRDVALLWRSQLKFFAMLWASFALGAGALGTVGAVMVHTDLLQAPSLWIVLGLDLVALVTGLVAGARPSLAFESQPRTGWEFFGQGVLIGLVCTVGVSYVAVAPLSGAYRLLFPVYRYLLNGAADVPLQAGADVIRSVYMDAVVAAPLVLPVAVLYLVLAWPFWMLVRMYSAR